MNAAPGYTRVAIVLHWLVALTVLCAFPLGMYMRELPLSPTKLQLYSYHKWLGISVLLLVATRLAWRIGHRPPPLLPGMPRWQEIAAYATHHSLYLLMLVIPLSGWLMSSALGFSVVWFGVVPLPDLVGKDQQLGELLKDVHATLNFTLLALILVHAAAAVKHHLFDHDGTLARMLPFLQARPRP